MVEVAEQCAETCGGALRALGALGSGEGEHFDLAVAQKQADGAQVVGGTVGIDDDVVTRLARMSQTGSCQQQRQQKQASFRQTKSEAELA